MMSCRGCAARDPCDIPVPSPSDSIAGVGRSNKDAIRVTEDPTESAEQTVLTQTVTGVARSESDALQRYSSRVGSR